ncbi:MAG: diacylglycerol kinase family protein [Clostridiales bacterium]|nr:diacylglycerol kinase family protein [Clostridiales bacterium]
MNKINIPLVKSFKYAIKGIISCIKTERNFRIHLSVIFYVIWFSSFYNFSIQQKSLLAIVVGFVIVTEMLNTAIEYIIDLTSPEYNRLAGTIKDIAAGAVSVSALVSVIVGVFLFWDLEKIQNIVKCYLDKPLLICLLLATLAVWLIIIFLPNKLYARKKGYKNDQYK